MKDVQRLFLFSAPDPCRHSNPPSTYACALDDGYVHVTQVVLSSQSFDQVPTMSRVPGSAIEVDFLRSNCRAGYFPNNHGSIGDFSLSSNSTVSCLLGDGVQAKTSSPSIPRLTSSKSIQQIQSSSTTIEFWLRFNSSAAYDTNIFSIGANSSITDPSRCNFVIQVR